MHTHNAKNNVVVVCFFLFCLFYIPDKVEGALSIYYYVTGVVWNVNRLSFKIVYYINMQLLHYSKDWNLSYGMNHISLNAFLTWTFCIININIVYILYKICDYIKNLILPNLHHWPGLIFN